MLEHIRILIFFVMFISGISLLFYLNRIYKSYPYNYIGAIKQYNIALIILYVIQIIAVYTDKNLSQDIGSVYIPIAVQTLELTYIILVISLYYFLLNILLNLRAKKIPKKLNLWILAISGLFIIIYFIRFFIPQVYSLFEWMDILRTKYGVIGFIINNIEIFVLIGFYFFWKDHKLKPERVRLSKSFIIFYIICDLLSMAAQLSVVSFDIPKIPALIIYAIVALLYLLAIFVWVKFFFLKYAQNILKLIDKDDPFKDTYLEYKITKREAEIIELLMVGKSVSEVAGLLFISHHTVKNHITHIYEKLNVKTRYEFIHFFIERSIK